MKFSDMSLTAKVATVGGAAIIFIVVGAVGKELLGVSSKGCPELPDVSSRDGQVDYSVELYTGDNGVLNIRHANQCRQRGHEGCLWFEAGKVGLIKFFMTNSRVNDKKCGDPSVDSVITKIELTTTVKAPDPIPSDVDLEASKGEFTGDLPDWVRDDAFSDVDVDTGIVYEATSLADARTQAWLVNMNSHDAEGGEDDKSFWYRVTATACEENANGEHDEWIVDPRGDNEGLR